MGKPKTDEALVQQAVEMYRQGETGRVAAKHFGIAESVMYRALRKEGIDAMSLQKRGVRGHANRRFSDEQEAEIAREYQEGASLSRLGHKYGVVLQTIRHTLRRRGVERRRRGGVLKDFSAEQRQQIVERWLAGESREQIATDLKTVPPIISRTLTFMGVQTRERRGAERHTDNRGYVLVNVPADSGFASMRSSAGYVLEHRLVMAKALGRPLTPDETVHHINGIRAENRLENLQLRQGKHGKGVVFACLDCGSHNIGTEVLT